MMQSECVTTYRVTENENPVSTKDAFYTKPRAKRGNADSLRRREISGVGSTAFVLRTRQTEREKAYHLHTLAMARHANASNVVEAHADDDRYHDLSLEDREWCKHMMAAYNDAVGLLTHKMKMADDFLFGSQWRGLIGAARLKLFCPEDEAAFLWGVVEDKFWTSASTYCEVGLFPFVGADDPYTLYGRHVSRLYDVLVDVRSMQVEFHFPQSREAAYATREGVVDTRMFPFIAYYQGEGGDVFGSFGGADEFKRAVRRPRATGW